MTYDNIIKLLKDIAQNPGMAIPGIVAFVILAVLAWFLKSYITEMARRLASRPKPLRAEPADLPEFSSSGTKSNANVETSGTISRKTEPPSDESLISEIVSRDPLIADRASSLLIDRPDLIHRIIDQYSESIVGEEAVKSVLRKFPELSAGFLMERYRKADTDFGYAQKSINYFDPVHGEYCTQDLNKTLINIYAHNPWPLKLSMDALGRCANSSLSTEIKGVIFKGDEYGLQKWGISAMEAISRFFVRSDYRPVGPFASQLVRCSSDFVDTVACLYKKSWPCPIVGEPMGDSSFILSECRGQHADILIAEWLKSECLPVIKTAAMILGYLRVARAVKPLINVMETLANRSIGFQGCTESEIQGLIKTVSICLGDIGTPEAFERLDYAGIGSGEGYGLACAIDRINNPVQFRTTATKLLTSKTDLNYLVIHAIGKHSADEFRAEVQSSLESSIPVERGVAVLTLTRLSNPPGKDTLLNLIKQSAVPVERLLGTLSLIRLYPDEYDAIEDQLRKDLSEIGVALRFYPTLEEDVSSVLIGTKHENAVRLEKAWRPFWGIRS